MGLSHHHTREIQVIHVSLNPPWLQVLRGCSIFGGDSRFVNTCAFTVLSLEWQRSIKHNATDRENMTCSNVAPLIDMLTASTVHLGSCRFCLGRCSRHWTWAIVYWSTRRLFFGESFRFQANHLVWVWKGETSSCSSHPNLPGTKRPSDSVSCFAERMRSFGSGGSIGLPPST